VLFGSAVHNSFQVMGSNQQHMDKIVMSDCDSIPSENHNFCDEAKEINSQYEGKANLMH